MKEFISWILEKIFYYIWDFCPYFFSYKVFTRYYFHDFLHEVPAVIGLSEKEAKKLLSKNDLEIKVMENSILIYRKGKS
ncbi:Uncharacterised protein [Fusobacterium necrophorum subsp. necrophorum]|nr:Uncharacterised protein [Fusobacterium necrophorum subsp. necrophorum]